MQSILYPTLEQGIFGLCYYCEEKQGEAMVVEGEKEFVCEDCDGHFTYCNVCEYYYQTDWDAPCRHIIWSETLSEWVGVGTCYSEQDAQIHKKSFFRVLDRVGMFPAQCLLRSLKRHKYHNAFGGTIFGWTYLNAYWLKNNKYTQDFGNLITDNLSLEEEESLEVGMAWLMSLWCDYYNRSELAVTPKADKITAKWVKEWISRKIAIALCFIQSPQYIYFKSL